MKSRTLLFVLAIVYSCFPAQANSTLLAKLSEKNPWEFIQYHLQEAPPEKVRSYKERRFNLSIATALWAATAYFATSDGDTYEQEVALENATVIALISAIVITFWAIIRNSYYLVWDAEKEAFDELLDNWSTTKDHLPTEIIEVFRAAHILRNTNRAQFDKEVPELIETIKKHVKRHQKDAHYFAISENIEKVANALAKAVEASGHSIHSVDRKIIRTGS